MGVDERLGGLVAAREVGPATKVLHVSTIREVADDDDDGNGAAAAAAKLKRHQTNKYVKTRSERFEGHVMLNTSDTGLF